MQLPGWQLHQKSSILQEYDDLRPNSRSAWQFQAAMESVIAHSPRTMSDWSGLARDGAGAYPVPPWTSAQASLHCATPVYKYHLGRMVLYHAFAVYAT